MAVLGFSGLIVVGQARRCGVSGDDLAVGVANLAAGVSGVTIWRLGCRIWRDGVTQVA